MLFARFWAFDNKTWPDLTFDYPGQEEEFGI